MLWHSLEAPRWGAFNEYPQHMFTGRNKKTMNTLWLTLLLLNTTCPVLANSVDPDQLASEEANWARSALFVT